MEDSPPDGVQISDGQTSPRTTIDDEETEERSLPELVYHELKPKWNRISRELPVSIPTAIGGVVVYLTILIGIAAGSHPYRAFGFLSATTGVLALTLLYHPTGVLKARTNYQRLIYYTVALSFVLVGIQYMLMGIVFHQPFSG